MSSVHFCRWDWCRETFNSHHELDDHVINGHIMTLQPKSIEEIEDAIKKDDALSESVSTGSYSLPSILAQPLQSQSQTQSQSQHYPLDHGAQVQPPPTSPIVPSESRAISQGHLGSQQSIQGQSKSALHTPTPPQSSSPSPPISVQISQADTQTQAQTQTSSTPSSLSLFPTLQNIPRPTALSDSGPGPATFSALVPVLTSRPDFDTFSACAPGPTTDAEPAAPSIPARYSSSDPAPASPHVPVLNLDTVPTTVPAPETPSPPSLKRKRPEPHVHFRSTSGSTSFHSLAAQSSPTPPIASPPQSPSIAEMVGKAAKSQHGTRPQNFPASTRSSRLHNAMSMAGLTSSTSLPRFPTATSMPRLNRTSSAIIVKRVPSANDEKKTQRAQNAKKAENGKKAQSAASLIRELALQFDAELAEPRVGAGGPIDVGTTGIGIGVDGTGERGSRESTRVGDVGGVDDVGSSGANSPGQLGDEDGVDGVWNEAGDSSEMDIEMQLTEGISTASVTKKVNGASPEKHTRSRSVSDRVSPTKEKENKVVGLQENEEMPRSQASQESFQFQLLTQPPYRSPQPSQRSIR